MQESAFYCTSQDEKLHSIALRARCCYNLVIMKLEFLQQILLDQKQLEVDAFVPSRYCPRAEESHVDLDSGLAQVVLGVRRCGKSTLCMRVMKNSGRRFAYVNFDDERLIGIHGEDFNTLLMAVYKVYGEVELLFMDEMQNVPEWFLFVNRLLRQGMHLVITGSNANLLSGELSTHLTGRFMETHLLPFSFREYCHCMNVVTSVPSSTRDAAMRSRALDEYLRRGGFPELMKENDSVAYVESLSRSIVERDVARRHRLRNVRELKLLASHLLNIVPTICNVSKCSSLLGLGSDHTSRRYLEYFELAYLLYPVQKYSTKSYVRLTNQKLYPVDVALMDCRENAFAGENLGWRLETVVFHELRRRNAARGRDVYYYQGRTSEADFLVCRGRHVEEIYQVAYDISNARTRMREIRGAQAASLATGCRRLTLVNYDVDEEASTPNGTPISIVPADKWLCRDDAESGK